jgi:integrase/recombinase XerD
MSQNRHFHIWTPERSLRSGANVRTVQTLMRHASLSSTMIYCAVDESERRDAIRRLAA